MLLKDEGEKGARFHEEVTDIPAAESAINVAGTPSWTSSNAVSLDPWLNGLVSVQYAISKSPLSWTIRTIPSAVPYPAVAKLPVLQCVKSRNFGLRTSLIRNNNNIF